MLTMKFFKIQQDSTVIFSFDRTVYLTTAIGVVFRFSFWAVKHLDKIFILSIQLFVELRKIERIGKMGFEPMYYRYIAYQQSNYTLIDYRQLMPCFFCCLYHLAISYLDYTFEHLWKLADTINGFNFAYYTMPATHLSVLAQWYQGQIYTRLYKMHLIAKV